MKFSRILLFSLSIALSTNTFGMEYLHKAKNHLFGSVKNHTKTPSAQENQTCVICQDEIKDGQQISTIACSSTHHHSFHSECLQPWLASHQTCPVCRTHINEPMITTSNVIKKTKEIACELNPFARKNLIPAAGSLLPACLMAGLLEISALRIFKKPMMLPFCAIKYLISLSIAAYFSTKITERLDNDRNINDEQAKKLSLMVGVNSYLLGSYLAYRATSNFADFLEQQI